MFSISKREKRGLINEKTHREEKKGVPFELEVTAALPDAHTRMPMMVGSGSSSKILYQLGAPVTLANAPTTYHEEVDDDATPVKATNRALLESRIRPAPNSADNLVNFPTLAGSRRQSYNNLNLRRRSSLALIPDSDSSPPIGSQEDTSTVSPIKLMAKPFHAPNGRRLSSQLSAESLHPSHTASSASSMSSTPPTSASGTGKQFVFNPNYTLRGQASSSSLGSDASQSKRSSLRKYRQHVAAEPQNSPILSIAASTTSSPQLPPKLPPKQKAKPLPREGESQAEDATEEIVPWMFEKDSDSADRRQRSDSTRPGSNRTRNLSSLSGRSLRSQEPTSPILRTTKSTVALQRQGSQASDESNLRKASKGLLGRLRRKTSKAELVQDETAWPMQNGNDPSMSPKAPTTPRKSVASLSRVRKQSSKDKKSSKANSFDRDFHPGIGSAGAAAAAATQGITLDLDMDHMEGIVNTDTLQAVAANGLPAYLNDTASISTGRPMTPDSVVLSTLQRRRPSMAPSLLGALDSGIDSAGDSPLSSRSILSSRRPSLAPEAIVWNASFTPRYASAQNGIGISLPHNGDDSHTDRKVSAGMQGAAAANAAARAAHAIQLAALGSAPTEASWTAPESWAVEDNNDVAVDGDHSDEEDQDLHSPAAGQTGTVSPLISSDERRESNANLDRPTSARGRPGTSGSFSYTDGEQATTFTIRIFKPDGTFTTLIAPFMQTAAEIQYSVSRKPGFVTKKGVHRLFVLEKGLERPMQGSERPVRLQQLRLQQAGYSEWDKLEELGREDHSYLIKFIFKPDPMHRSGAEDVHFDSFEYVDLRGKSLTSIPIILFNHGHEIVSLYVSRNPKLDLPADFVQLCTKLRELRMSENAIKRVPQSIKHASGLTRLDISTNRILDLDHIRLSELQELTRLEAFNNRLFALPDYFGEFRSLKYLIISNNKFDKFPAIICQIASLVELDVSFNMLTSLPDEIGQLTGLERMILAGNKIAALPATFNRLVSLRELDARNNIIEDFSVLNHLPKLQKIQLERNRCTTLCLELVVMKTFKATFNPITKFSLTGIARTLTCLNLSNAKLMTLSDNVFAEMASLENLWLDHNQLRALPANLEPLINLTLLSVRFNKLETLPDSIGCLTSLQTLKVSNNDLHSLPSAIWLLGELGSLNASSNLLTEFPDPPTISVPQTSVNGPEGSVPDRKPGLPAAAPNLRGNTPLIAVLEHLYLADNRLSDEIFHPVSLMTELKVLNISFNDIYEIPHKTLCKNSQLETLYISGNKLTTLPEDDFEKLINLRILHLNGNKLNTLPAELGTLKRLQGLDVGSNMLKYNIANWKYDWNWNWNLELRYLNLSGNKRLEIKPVGQQQGQEGMLQTAKKRNLSDFSALRKIKTLGLMDVTLTIPSIPDDNDERRVRTSLSVINEMGYGIADTLGDTDTLAIIDLVIPKFRGKDDECLVGIFEGHLNSSNNSARLPRFLQDSFGPRLVTELDRMVEGEADISDVLRRAFINLNRDFGNTLAPSMDSARRPDTANDRMNMSSRRAGASAIVAYIAQRVLYVANTGHTQGVLAGRNGQARPLSFKHDPLELQEYTRIRAAEGWISNKGLVNDDVPTSRAFGHLNVFPAVNASPSIQVIELSELDELVIFANGGIWDYIDHQTAVDIARGERSDPMMAAQKLRDLAVAYGSTGHLMAMVVNVSDLFKTKSAPKRRGGVALDSAAGYALTKSANSRGRGGEVALGERYLTMVDREIPAPTGTVALVFTDIRNSTAMWESIPEMHVAVRLHNQIMRRQLRSIGGYEVKTEGDAFMCSFPSVTSAVLWAFTCQLELLKADWPQSILDCEDGMEVMAPDGELIYRGLCVRMGIHWGQPHCEADPITRRMDYFGPMVNRSARIEGVADGGQIACSAEVIEIVKSLCGEKSEDVIEDQDDGLDEAVKRDITAIRNMGVCITELGERRLKGLETSDVLSLIYPTALATRLKYTASQLTSVPAAPIMVNGAVSTTEIAPVPHLIEVALIQTFGITTLRLEAAVSTQSHPSIASLSHSSPLVRYPGSPTMTRGRRKASLHPHLTEYPIRLDATDEELLAILEALVIRVENVVNSMTLVQLGPYTDVLATLSEITRNKPAMLLNALSIFAGVTGQNRSNLPSAM